VSGASTEIRTPVLALTGLRPVPLDDGASPSFALALFSGAEPSVSVVFIFLEVRRMTPMLQR
jgi:hypothetical protein